MEEEEGERERDLVQEIHAKLERALESMAEFETPKGARLEAFVHLVRDAQPLPPTAWPVILSAALPKDGVDENEEDLETHLHELLRTLLRSFPNDGSVVKGCCLAIQYSCRRPFAGPDKDVDEILQALCNILAEGTEFDCALRTIRHLAHTDRIRGQHVDWLLHSLDSALRRDSVQEGQHLLVCEALRAIVDASEVGMVGAILRIHTEVLQRWNRSKEKQFRMRSVSLDLWTMLVIRHPSAASTLWQQIHPWAVEFADEAKYEDCDQDEEREDTERSNCLLYLHLLASLTKPPDGAFLRPMLECVLTVLSDLRDDRVTHQVWLLFAKFVELLGPASADLRSFVRGAKWAGFFRLLFSCCKSEEEGLKILHATTVVFGGESSSDFPEHLHPLKEPLRESDVVHLIAKLIREDPEENLLRGCRLLYKLAVWGVPGAKARKEIVTTLSHHLVNMPASERQSLECRAIWRALAWIDPPVLSPRELCALSFGHGEQWMSFLCRAALVHPHAASLHATAHPTSPRGRCFQKFLRIWRTVGDVSAVWNHLSDVITTENDRQVLDHAWKALLVLQQHEKQRRHPSGFRLDEERMRALVSAAARTSYPVLRRAAVRALWSLDTTLAVKQEIVRLTTESLERFPQDSLLVGSCRVRLYKYYESEDLTLPPSVLRALLNSDNSVMGDRIDLKRMSRRDAETWLSETIDQVLEAKLDPRSTRERIDLIFG